MNLVSVIVPCFNEEEALPYFYDEIVKISKLMQDVDFEFIFVNDGSKDKTLSVIKNLAKNDSRVKYISFSRNFGKEAAIYAGFQNCIGDYAVLMDADLQDPPHLLPEMYKAIVEEGYDSVATRRVTRKGEPPIRSFFARAFYKIINRISDADIVDGARDYRLMKRSMVNAILSMAEYNRFSKGIFGWIGFDTKWIPFNNVERVAGSTKWNFKSLFSYALEGIFSFSTAPLKLAGIVGIILFIGSILLSLYTAISTLLYGNDVSGYTTIVCLILFLSGTQMLFIAILGEYISKDYMENKARPIYIVKDSNKKMVDNKLNRL